MFNINNRRNIGIVAHVDAGKTTLTEMMLYNGGTIRLAGSVDKGTAHTDSMEVERERGISVKAAEATIEYKDTVIHLIDTPGHVDFSAEVERALRILDGAVVVVSAVEGVQPQTEIYFKALKALGIPVIFFVNKIDRIGADIRRVEEDIKRLLVSDVIPLQEVIYNEAVIHLQSKINCKDSTSKDIVEFIAERDEEFLEKYLIGEVIDKNDLLDKLKYYVSQKSAYPIFYGSALKGIGVEEVIEGIIEFLPPPQFYEDSELSAVVYKITQSKRFGKLCFIRLYSGSIKSRDDIFNFSKDITEKVTQIKKVVGLKLIDCSEVTGGELACISGLNYAGIGDVIGEPKHVKKITNIANPILTIQVLPQKESELIALVDALTELEEEDPLMKLQWIKEKREINIQIMGVIQLEVLKRLLQQRYNLEVEFGQPSVIYKETITETGYGFDAYTMPKPCWAILKFEMEPLAPGSGILYSSIVRTEKIKQRYQNEVEKRVPEALKQGLYGWEVTDIKITLIAGEDHYMHTHPGDFIVATPMALMNGLQNIGTTILEPFIKFRISVPEDIGGKVLTDIINMRGEFTNPIIDNGNFTVEGEMPVATSLEYSIRLSMISGGKGTMTTSFSNYRPCPLELAKTRERIGVNPLERAKYILSIRNALT